ncbi:MAG: HlyC/CorC family transporter [Actinomycetia bacterium]|nr:HlyC/CorC family transporter [Actinomycetes bacterium]
MAGFFSSTETAFTTLSRAKVRYMVEEGKKDAEKIEKLLENPTRVLSTILIGNNVVNILASALATYIALQISPSYGVGIATGVMTFLILVFGEICPKTYAIRHADKIVLFSIKIISFFSIVLYPVALILIFISNGFLRLFGEKETRKTPFLTEEEIKSMVSIGEEEGVIHTDEKRMIHSIFKFGDTIVKEVMTPRMEMVCLKSDSEIKEVVETSVNQGYSRIPVYEDKIDNITGVVYVKDLIPLLLKEDKTTSIKKIIRPAYYVPETKKVNELLKELQANKVHMAVVLDEYGGTAGLITIEDLIEEIVGEIFDEYDFKKEPIFKKISDDTYLVDGRVDLEEAKELLGMEISDENIETFGGFVYHLFGKVPREGESIEYKGYIFKVERVERRRISKVFVKKKTTHIIEGKKSKNEKNENIISNGDLNDI